MFKIINVLISAMENMLNLYLVIYVMINVNITDNVKYCVNDG